MERPNFDVEIRPTPPETLDLPQISPQSRPEMERLQFLLGTWDVTASTRFRDTWVQSRSEATFRSILDDGVIEERLVLSLAGTRLEILAHWCWDRYRETYRMVRSDNLSSRSNVFEGEFIDEEHLVFTNLRCDTVHVSPGQRKHNRFALRIASSDHFQVLVDGSFDGGASWTTTNHYDIVRRDS